MSTRPLLYFQELGSGSPIVILHGLFGSGDNWRSIARKLSENSRVILPDLRNHGQSFHSTEITYRCMAEDVLALMTSLNIENATIVGHSMGGKTAMSIAALAPDRVNKLVIVDIAPVAYGRRHDEILTALTTLTLEAVTSRGQADQLLEAGIPDAALRGFLLKNLTEHPTGHWRWKMNLPALIENYENIANPPPFGQKPFPNKAIFLRGALSDYILPEHDDLIRKHFSNAEIITVPDAGHWLHVESQATVIQAIIGLSR